MAEATLRMVAERAGVHYATASRALDPGRRELVRPETRARVERAARDLDYRPDLLARSLRRGATKTIGVVVADLGNPFIPPIIRGLTETLEAAEFLAIIAETQDDSRRLDQVLDLLLSRRVDGLVISAAKLGDRDRLLDLASRGLPVVLAARALPGTDLPAVTFDGERAGQLVVEHFARLEHEVLAQIAGPPDIASFVERGIGFAQACQRLGLSLVPVPAVAGQPTMDEGRRLMEELLGQPDPATAVFAHNDLLAIGAIEALEARGLNCPGDVSIIGHDDSPLVQRIAPPLTTISTPGAELGRLAGMLALDLIRDPDRRPPSLALSPTLVLRGSTALRTPEGEW